MCVKPPVLQMLCVGGSSADRPFKIDTIRLARESPRARLACSLATFARLILWPSWRNNVEADYQENIEALCSRSEPWWRSYGRDTRNSQVPAMFCHDCFFLRQINIRTTSMPQPSAAQMCLIVSAGLVVSRCSMFCNR